MSHKEPYITDTREGKVLVIDRGDRSRDTLMRQAPEESEKNFIKRVDEWLEEKEKGGE